MRNIIRRDSSISSEILAQLALKYPNLNIYWLLTGEGNMLQNEPITSQNCTELKEHLKTAQDLIETQKMLIEQLKKG